MERDRKCILCETVHASKQEMDEHMRSMLHHRELEKLRGRDCGHECRVCKVTVVSLTEYASHISSPTHKQKVEAAEQKNAGPDCNEDYFDQVLVDLIEKRKEQIRKEKEAAAAKLAKEEEERRRKEEFQQRLKEVKEQYRLDGAWQKSSYGFSRPGQQGPWYRGNPYNAREEESRPWPNNVQGKSATWHAQEPPNYQRWGPGDFAGEHMHSQEGCGNRRWDQGPFPGNQRIRLPWLSNGGSSNGIYGRNNISQMSQRGRHMSLVGPPLMFQSSPSFFGKPFNQFNQDGCSGEGSRGQGRGFQNGERPTAEHDLITNKNSKTLGSNPKLDKDCRWSPYPVTKGVESVSHKDTHQNALEKHPKVPTPHRKDNPSDNKALKKPSQLEEKPGQPTSGGQCVEEKRRHTASSKTQPRERSSSGSRSSSKQREEPLNRSSSQKSLQQKDQKTSSALSANSATRASSTSQLQPKSTSKQSGSSRQAPPSGPFQSKQERQLPEILKKAKQVVAEKRSSLESSKKQEADMAQQLGVNKENSRRQNATPHLPSTVRPEKPANKSLDSSQFLQSFQVSTSTMESSEPAAPNREEEENRKKELETSGVGMQSAVMGQSSESETSRTGDTQQQAPGLSKLDLPPVLKRDLTKHISSKSKAGGHEPNLNIARRVRNLSESRRSDSEKDSGLKPTVRQLISSSGSRRNVNWEQVYQEVRKKQDKGKGMPRFGIEMVPLDQEEQSQEEDDIPLLEGFHWDSLMEVSASTTSRKRSLSESSLAPGSTASVFTSLMSPEMPQSEGLEKEQQGSSLFRSKEAQREPELEKMLCEIEAKVETQADERTVTELQRSDSFLVDSGSGTDQYDGQGTGKRRRRVKDAPSAETSCSEHNNKRRKVKPKKERLQIDRLLAVSLREEELSRSLQTLDTSLIQARGALEAAYMEVQRLSVVKQQMATEMNTLRNKRIELLKGMQGSREELPQGKLKENNVISVKSEPHTPLSSSPLPSAAVSPNPAAERASPPSSTLPFGSITIKQEPQSPIHVNSEPDPADQMTLCAHSTTPELQTAAAAAAASSLGPALHSQSSPALKLELHQTDQTWENFSESADCNESFPEPHGTVEKAVQATRNILTSLPDFRPSIKLSPSRRNSEVGSVGDCAASQSFEAPVAPSLLSMPASPSELRSGKRVRKLKKRKLLKKALGAQQPESSDTELDGEAMRPRWLRPRRRSGGSQVSTSSPPSEDRDADVIMEGDNEPCRQQHPTIGHHTANQKSPKHMVELPLVAPAELTANLDSDEGMEVSEVCQQPPDTDTQLPVAPPAPESLTTKQQSLGCNEVTSTSDMDICKSSESDAHSSILLPKILKTSSDVSSDHGEDDLPTEGVFEGHQEAVNAMQIHNGLLYTCSGDRTVRAFDLVSHKCVGVFEGHTSKVSCLLVSVAPCLRHRLYSGSSDQTIRCYNLKTHELEQQFSLSDRVLCLHSRWKILFAGLANGTVVTFNLKTNKQMDVFECHGPRAVSCLASSQEGARWILLVGSFDSTISVRDAKSGLLLRTLEGHTKTVLCMKVVNDLVFSGSSDQSVYAHNIHTGELVRVYEGHSHAVTVVTVLGKVMVTACLDKLVRVYDLQSHDQLQVYGGHKDMVMCMAVHKNMIYTGCYDGSVEAVKLNLLQNFRCWWHGCSLVFGLMEHLQQHLADDHASANVQTALKCRWKNCEEFFCARSRSKQAMLLHLQKHAEEENQLEP